MACGTARSGRARCTQSVRIGRNSRVVCDKQKKHTRQVNLPGMVAASRKPGSVARDGRPSRAGGHSSGTLVTERLVRPTQGLGRTTLERPSTWPCSGWGLPCRNRYRLRGGLLPHLFTLTRGAKAARAVYFSVALSSRFPSPGVTRHPALRSPDFPRGYPRDRLRCCGARSLNTNAARWVAL